MAADRGPAQPPPASISADATGPGSGAREMGETSFVEPLERGFAALRRMAANYAILGGLDLRRATLQLAWLVGAGILITVLVVTAWLAGVVALAAWLVGQGVSWPGVLLIAALLNLVLAALVLWRIRNVFEQAPFTATLRQLRVDPRSVEKGESQ